MNAVPLRILHVCTTMNMGGAETMLMNYYRHIDTALLQFDFLLHREEQGFYEAEILRRGGRIHRLPALTLRSAPGYPGHIRHFLREHPEYDCIHIHSSGVAFFVARAAHRLGRKVIIQHAHACARDCYDLTTPIRFFCKIATRRYLTHFFGCGTQAAAWLFGRANAAQAIILPNAIETERFRYSPAIRTEQRKKYGWENNWVIGNVARFCPQKNHFRMLRIFAAVLRRAPHAILVLVAEKMGYYEELRAAAEQMGLSKHIVFTGGRQDVAELLQAFDVFLFPSLFEGLSVAMVEAQAAGLHIVTSDGVARESALCEELVDFVPLARTDEDWAEFILRPYNRQDTHDRICRKGYDIAENARLLTSFYCRHLQQ